MKEKKCNAHTGLIETIKSALTSKGVLKEYIVEDVSSSSDPYYSEEGSDNDHKEKNQDKKYDSALGLKSMASPDKD